MLFFPLLPMLNNVQWMGKAVRDDDGDDGFDDDDGCMRGRMEIKGGSGRSREL